MVTIILHPFVTDGSLSADCVIKSLGQPYKNYNFEV